MEIVAMVARTRVGESHPAAKISDREVDIIRELHERGVSYETISEAWCVSKSTIAGICQYRRRAATPDRYQEAGKWKKKRGKDA